MSFWRAAPPREGHPLWLENLTSSEFVFDFRTSAWYVATGRRNGMQTQTLTMAPTPARAFPVAEVKRRLRIELQRVAADASVLRPEWEPLLDSQRVVGTVLAIEDLFPSCR